MKEILYFNLKSQDKADELVAFVKTTIVPVAQEIGCQQIGLYETVGDALSRYMLEAVFESEEAANAALQSEQVREVSEKFLEFVQDVTLIPYQAVC